MIHRLLWMAFLCLSLVGSAQNLIPNPSFEDTVCVVPGYLNPYDWPFYTPALHWFNPNAATPDFYSVAHQEGFSCGFLSMYDTDLQNVGEWQFPKDGLRMAGIWAGNGINLTRELLSSQLLTPLVADSSYCFSMYVSLRNGSNLAIDRLGAYFSVDSVFDHSWPGGFEIDTRVVNSTGEFLTDTLDWMQVSGVYTANGGERFILIGNADDDSETLYQQVDGMGEGIDIAYYFIDELQLGLCSTLNASDLQKEPELQVFLSGGWLRISADMGTDWMLTDLLGKVIASGSFPTSGESVLEFSEASGIYLFRWISEGAYGSRKVYITR